ncbi:MAG: DNA polymerase III subunit delta' [Alteromonadaceae bacterium]|uniref:GlcG/HbpS family heme-binding protein n=1 Tax=unclassified Marinobacter TaxID=83889 RepID=UPI000C61EEFD|nr:heme-binding protein [Marinobacter sp. BGYM27]MAA65106.1 DNA polymerase III subunit delta' [Alteromonadaceae bacterium]MBH85411.1 DNA polymerase III subunit delta' [Alteromonadaceae bacterium]MDG5499947.1 heme-binding protein [Marinobacter sp. BGYM27]|tara:strand:- start:18391 stop:18816 length:426 start_codon:yes stop_codon:yes gene_type:complete
MLTMKRLDLADARLLIEGAARKSQEIGVPMCIAITDESGNLVAFERMDGGKTSSVIVAQDKAYTAAAARKATHDYNKVCVPGNLAFGIHTEVGGRLSTVGGGLPVTVDGEVVGGIGLSSGTPQQDMDCAQAGIDHFMAARG